MNPYCQYCIDHPEDLLNCDYHDHDYGFPLTSDDALFERLMLEINQAGLSWITILKKAPAFRNAFDGFSVSTVAGYGPDKVEQLMNDAGIIRNRKKIEAAIHNASVIEGFRANGSSFKGWLDERVKLGLDEWVKDFKKTFTFTGPEIVKEFLWSTGYLSGAHSPDCPVFEQIELASPPWMGSSDKG